MSVDIFVRFRPLEGQEAAVLQILRGMVGPTRQEAGNQRYDLLQSSAADGRREYHLIERYRDEAAIAAHRETAHYKAYRAAIVPLLDGAIQVTVMQALDVAAP